MKKEQYKKNYYILNKERLKKLRRIRYKKNKLIAAEQARLYRLRNKNKLSKYKRAYHIRNREHHIQLGKKNYLKNKQRHLQTCRRSKEGSLNNFLRYLFCGIKSRKMKYGKTSITLPDIINLYHKQKGLCAISQVPMSHRLNSLDAISIDRIDSKRGYTLDNIQLICQFINFGKRDHRNEEAIEFIQKVKGVK